MQLDSQSIEQGDNPVDFGFTPFEAEVFLYISIRKWSMR